MMHLVVLPLSLGAAIMSIVHGVMLLLSKNLGQDDSGTWVTGALLFSSALLALIGALLAFNRRRIGALFLFIAAVICLFAHDETWPYAGVYAVGGILSLFVRKADEEDYDEDEEEDDEEEDEADEPLGRGGARDFSRVSYGGRRNLRASKIQRNDREERNFRQEGDFEPERVRSSKVCPACGASVGIDHKFCFVCGGSLCVTRPDAAAPDSPPERNFFDLPADDRADEADFSDKFRVTYPVDGDAQDDDEPYGRIEEDLGEENDDDTLDEEDTDDDGDDAFDEEEHFGREPLRSHKVLVRPEPDDQPVPRRPLSISPDSSYREFSQYARRRKRKNRSLARRVLGPLLLLFAVGGTAWFLLNLRTVPDPIVVKEPKEEPERPDITPPVEPPAPTPDPFSISIQNPARGVVLGTNVNVRADHSTSSSVVMRLNANAQAEVRANWEGVSGNLSGPWYRIRTSDGKEGWIFGRYFQPLDGRENTLPSGHVEALLGSFGAGKGGVTASLGSPSRTTGNSASWNGITATFRGDSESVSRLQITSPRHVLKNGVVVGMNENLLYRTVGYPSAYRSGQLLYLETPSLGMSVRLKDGKVQSIAVGNM